MKKANKKRSASGFSLIETLVAILILTFGVLSLVMVFTQGLFNIATSQEDLIAKEKAAEAIESVFTGRDIRVLTWAQIRNVRDGGLFLDGAQPMNTGGDDSLVNTGDANENIESYVKAGVDNVLGTGDDVTVDLRNFTREIVITDVAPNLRQIQVIIRYQVGRMQRDYTLTTYISSYA